MIKIDIENKKENNVHTNELYTLSSEELSKLMESIVRSDIRFESLDDLYEYASNNGDKVLKIVNLSQIGFYASIGNCQPCWIDQSPYDRRIVGYYLESETKYAWYRWRRTAMSNEKKQKY